MSKQIKILSIEDDEFMRVFLKDVFWLYGHKKYDFHMVSSLKQAEEFLSKHKKNLPDLIFLDLRLPEKKGGKPNIDTGFSFLKELKTQPETKDIKIIIFSGFSESVIRRRALDLGADRFLLKGEYLPRELIKATHELFSHKKK